MLPPSILQDESSAEERIQEADDPIPYISKYEPLHTATATLLAISLISCCMEGGRCQKVFCDSGKEGASAGRSPTR